MDWIGQDHGWLDGMCFVSMIVGNLTAYRALTMSQWVAQSQVPLKIMMAPLRTQAGTVKVYMKFVEFLARRVVALHEKLGPGVSDVLLEPELTDQSISARHRRSHSASPARKPKPSPQQGSESPPQHSSPKRSTPKKSMPKPPAKAMFSPQSQNLLKMWETMDSNGDNTQSDQEGKEKPHKCCSGAPNGEEPLAKKVKMDVSNMYDKLLSEEKKDDSRGSQSEATKAKMSSSSSKKAKKDKKKKSKKSKKDKKDKKEKSNKKDVKDQDKPKSDKKPEKKTPEKSGCNVSNDKALDVPKVSRPKKKTFRTIPQCHQDKWASDYDRVVEYRQCVGISVHTLAEGCHYNNHTDYIRQLMRELAHGLNARSLEDRIEELKGLSSDYHKALRASLKTWQSKNMGNSGISPQYVVKAFIEPKTQRKISGHHPEHWQSDLMLGLYGIHQYEAISKENMQRAENTQPSALGYCPICSYHTGNHQSINNHVCAHYCLLLECGYGKCTFVEADCKQMYEDGIKKHSTTIAEAADNA